MKLAEICTLKSGFQGKTTEGKDYNQIKLKDVTTDGVIKYEELETFNAEKVNEKYLLKKGDIILKAKSGDNTAAIIEEDIENTVAAAHFIIITVKDTEELDPNYLVAYLNSEYAQDYFKRNAEGTAQPIVKIKTLEELEVKEIKIEQQERIGDFYKLKQQEKMKIEEFLKKRELQFKALLRTVIEEGENI